MTSLVSFTTDLTAHNGTRVATILDVLGPRWNATEVSAGEAQSPPHALRQSGLHPGGRPRPPRASQVRLPSASTQLLRQPGGGGLHPARSHRTSWRTVSLTNHRSSTT